MSERAETSPRGLRGTYAAAALCTIAAGLLWRRPELGLPPLSAKYGGSILWGVMVFFIVAALLPSARAVRVAAIAAIIAACVEFSQAIHIGWLDAIREHAWGRLLLGRTFDWWDIPSYWLGIALALSAAMAVRRALGARLQ